MYKESCGFICKIVMASRSVSLVFLFQVQTLKVLVNLSSNPDMMDDIVQAQVKRKG